jgi:DNA-binding CsgD family transcriptional regulator
VIDGKYSEEEARGVMWRALSLHQRLLLVTETAPREQRIWWEPKRRHKAAYALEMHGLMHEESGEWTLTVEGRLLSSWARERGYAVYVVDNWKFSEPEAGRRQSLEELVRPRELAELASEGMYASEIARRLEVSPQTIQRASLRYGVTLPRQPARTDPARIAELAAEGLHTAAIARRLGVSRQAVVSAAERYNLEIPPYSPAPRPEPEPYPWPDAWTANQCAECWGIKPSTWHGYVNQARTPEPLPGLDERGRKRWDPEAVKAALLARPGVGHDRSGVRARVGVGGRDKIARELAQRWADGDGWVDEELVDMLDQLAQAYRLKN